MELGRNSLRTTGLGFGIIGMGWKSILTLQLLYIRRGVAIGRI